MFSKQIWKWQVEKKKPIVTGPELGRYVVRYHYLPLPVDVSSISPCFDVGDGLRVVQTPSRRDYKDTDALIEVCDSLDNVELRIVEGRPYEDVVEALRWGDVYFCSLGLGQIGVSAREAAAYGLAVVSRLQPIVRSVLYDCPVLNVRSVEELRGALSGLAVDREQLVGLKRRSRGWAEALFSYEAVAPMMEGFYEYMWRCDDPGAAGKHTDIWQRVAKEEHGIKEFVDPCEPRW
jgi:glycosyltransferase involved in cell wall biosynthesis